MPADEPEGEWETAVKTIPPGNPRRRPHHGHSCDPIKTSVPIVIPATRICQFLFWRTPPLPKVIGGVGCPPNSKDTSLLVGH